MSMQIATEIRNQIGHRALYMLGAKIMVGDERSFSFRIRGSKRVNYIKITLNSMDTYDMEFGKLWGMKYNLVSEPKGICCDKLHQIIRNETGLATNL